MLHMVNKCVTGSHHSSVVSSALSIQWPWVQTQAHHLCILLFSMIYSIVTTICFFLICNGIAKLNRELEKIRN